MTKSLCVFASLWLYIVGHKGTKAQRDCAKDVVQHPLLLVCVGFKSLWSN